MTLMALDTLLMQFRGAYRIHFINPKPDYFKGHYYYYADDKPKPFSEIKQMLQTIEEYDYE